jgi:hypothetical protein
MVKPAREAAEHHTDRAETEAREAGLASKVRTRTLTVLVKVLRHVDCMPSLPHQLTALGRGPVAWNLLGKGTTNDSGQQAYIKRLLCERLLYSYTVCC